MSGIIKSAIAPYLYPIRVAGAMVSVALIAWALWTAYDFAYDNGYNAANVRAEKIIGDMAKGEAAAQARAREIERKSAERMAEIARQHEQDKADAQAAAGRLTRDLRAGTVRLRKEWAGCETGRASEAGRSAAELDAEAAARERLAAEIVGIGRSADDWIKRLQDVIRADRAGQGAEPVR